MVGKVKIYLDVIWLLNFFIDLLLIFLTSIILKRHVKKFRLILGAIVASLYIFAFFSPLETFAYHPLVKSSYSLLIIYASFGFIRFRLFFQAWLTFYFVNFAVGGGLLGLHFFLDYEMSFIKGTFATRTSGFGSPISWLFVAIGFPFIYMFSKHRFHSLETEKLRYDQIFPVTVIVGDIQLDLKGFVDSGNRLEDPFSRRPVMFIDFTQLSEQFPQSFVQFIKNSTFSNEEIPKEFEGKLFLLPYRTVSDNHQFLWAIRPEKVFVYENGKKFDCSNVLIACSSHALSDRQDYDCLLHPKMMQMKKMVI